MQSKQKHRHRKVHIKESGIDGVGIFAKRNIKRHEGIAVIKGELVSHMVVDKKTSAVGQNWIGVGKNKWINPTIFAHINHSCDPNAGIKGSRTIVALKNIKKGEEIFIDYSITEEDALWVLNKKCQCGSKKCRKVIKSIQFLPKKVFDSYLPYIPKYFQKVYTKYHRTHGK
ncbi:MAG: Nuclear protein SET [Candidatus Yanofskybacteria bacterium GW2011_GWA1_48_10]|uniref:Nuclear protein SET n=2 Tax=Parcubacteria group TaxID=1794811 RepID=A0A0G1U6S0_9BACT|nr:MAG: Nuclear protein SET [Candidatus Nomurabacteria bacterium GW2011_GWB1_47_6]KKU89804.1 MAG: Nuclear protein SET [Candidatus Yanofskybacteria bacterium GW2011_GWA1_48_10]